MSKMDSETRRNHLKATNNPQQQIDYVVSYDGAIKSFAGDKTVRIKVRFIPDKLILPPTAFSEYINALELSKWDYLEVVKTN